MTKLVGPVKIKMIAKTFHGLEEVLAKEIIALGGENVEILNRAVLYYGDKSLLYKSNLYLRTALRILIPVIETQVRSQEEFYTIVREFEWENYLKKGNTIAVDTFISSTVFTHSHFVALRTKDAIADRFREKYNRRPSIDIENPDTLINVHLAGPDLTISVDSSGASLHKRGYRISEAPAPLSEVLAAGLILLTGWNGESDFYDPMCGSGTLSIEASLIAREIPPGIFRSKFGFENSPDFEQDLWNDLFDNINEKDWKGKILASDLSRNAIRIASDNAKQASVFKNISFREIAFEAFPMINNGGLVVLNPPYGKRMVKTDINSFYQMIGDVMKKSFVGADVWVLSGNLESMSNIGLRPAVKHTLFNGAIECRYNKYEIYAGSRKSKYKND
jgi:putative N6-adenine-specific DNA methylase